MADGKAQVRGEKLGSLRSTVQNGYLHEYGISSQEFNARLVLVSRCMVSL